jgi:hypothetical protein
LVLDALPVKKVGIDAHTAAPEAVGRWRWWWEFVFLGIEVGLDVSFHVIAGFFVSCKVHTDRADGLETLGPCHVWDAWSVLHGLRVEDQHAEADERVAEEDRDGEQDHDEEDMDLLAEVAVGQSNCEV